MLSQLVAAMHHKILCFQRESLDVAVSESALECISKQRTLCCDLIQRKHKAEQEQLLKVGVPLDRYAQQERKSQLLSVSLSFWCLTGCCELVIEKRTLSGQKRMGMASRTFHMHLLGMQRASCLNTPHSGLPWSFEPWT